MPLSSPRRLTHARVPRGSAGARPPAPSADELRALREQIIVIAIVLAGCVWALLSGAAYGVAGAAAATAVEIVLAWRLIVCTAVERDRVLDLIFDGHAEHASVARERGRLMEKRYRHRLARSIDALQAEAAAPMLRRPSELPLYRRRVVAAVAPELAAIADALRGEEADVRGVALCVRLLSGGDSPLYGDDTERLREELARVRFLLASPLVAAESQV